MSRPKIDFKRVLIPSDSVAIIVILVGLLIAFFLEEIAIRVIGMSVSVLGAVALFLLISQRISEIVEIKHTPKQPPMNFKVTKTKGPSATSTVFEDFDSSFGPETDEEDLKRFKKDKPPKSPPIKEPPKDMTNEDEGFRVVSAIDKKEKKEEPKIDKPVKTEPEQKPVKEETRTDEPIKEYSDDFSGMKVIGPAKDKKKDEEKVESPKKSAAFRDKKDPELKVKEEVKAEETETRKQDELKFEAPAKEPVIEEVAKKPEQPPVAEKEKPEKEDCKQKQEYRETKIDMQLPVFNEDLPQLGGEPRKEFEYFLNRVLMLIRSVTNTRTAAFILVNADKREFILESYVTDVKNAVRKKAKFPIGNDVISQIYLNQKPVILTEITPSAELDLFPYYDRPVKTLSFIGVPVFYEKSVVGILCADTNVLDAYDSVTVNFFGHFTKLISAMVYSYTDKYDLIQDSRTLDAINGFRAIMDNSELSLEDILRALLKSAVSIFDYKTIGICAYDSEQQGWAVIMTVTSDENAKAFKGLIDVENSLLGESIMNYQCVAHTPDKGKRMLVHKDEEPLESGYFISSPIPLKSLSNIYGSLFMESAPKSVPSAYDVNIMETLCDHTGSYIEKLHLMDMLHNGAIFDNSTGMLNTPAFYQRLEEELVRNKDFEIPVTLCLQQIDKYASFDPEKYENRMEQVLYHVINMNRKHLRPYDIFGKADSSSFGILLIGMKLEQAQMWAESLRQDIAMTLLDIEERKFAVTVSMGLAEGTNSDSVGDLMDNTRKVLGLSAKKTNTVTIFS